MRTFSQGDPVELRVTERIGWVPAVVTYAGDSFGKGSGVSHYIVDTQAHGRFAVTPQHADLRAGGR